MILRPVPPFRLDLTVWALRRRARNAIDRWDGTTYGRAIVVGRRRHELAVRQEGPAATPRLVVTVTPSIRTPFDRQRLRSTIDRLLGLRVDLAQWYRMAERDRHLRRLAARFRGLKPPRFPTLFETLVNAVACQQLSLDVGLELLNRLAVACDVTRTAAGGDAHYAFPAPRDLARLSSARYRAIGFSRQKSRALRALALALDRHEVDLDRLASLSDTQATAELLQLRGVGRWTAEYVLLRGLGRLHVFPGDDAGAQKSLARWLGRSSPLDYAGVQKAVGAWSPYAGLVYFHLLLEGLSRSSRCGELPEHDERDQVVGRLRD
jgi:DNA-3-methyladenine glycosylase II